MEVYLGLTMSHIGSKLLIMKKILTVTVFLLLLFAFHTLTLAVEVAPRISDKEIIEKLSRLEQGQGRLEERIDAVGKRIDGLETSLNKRIDDLRADMNSRFNLLTWMIGLFVTLTMVILGFVLRMQWQMNRRQAQMETSLETQKDELAFFKGLIDKLLPPKGAL